MASGMARLSSTAADRRRLRALRIYSGYADVRIKWLLLFFRGRVDEDMRWNADDLADEGINERHFDTCFEMGDSGDVLAGFMPTVLADAALSERVRDFIGAASFAEWTERARTGASQASLF